MFTVADEFDPDTNQASTTVKIYYRNWWKFRRKRRFVSQETMDHASVESYQRPLEAQLLIARLKRVTGKISSPMKSKTWSRRTLRS